MIPLSYNGPPGDSLTSKLKLLPQPDHFFQACAPQKITSVLGIGWIPDVVPTTVRIKFPVINAAVKTHSFLMWWRPRVWIMPLITRVARSLGENSNLEFIPLTFTPFQILGPVQWDIQ